MSELPKVLPEEIFKSLYEKESKESKELREQVATMEILASKLRNERDTARSELAQRDELLRSLREQGVSDNPDTIEGEVLEDG